MYQQYFCFSISAQRPKTEEGANIDDDDETVSSSDGIPSRNRLKAQSEIVEAQRLEELKKRKKQKPKEHQDENMHKDAMQTATVMQSLVD